MWLIDFGAVGLIDPVTMDALQLMGAGLATGQPALLARALRSIAGSDGDAIEPRPWRPNSAGCSASSCTPAGSTRAACRRSSTSWARHDIPVPPTFTLLARAMVTLEGTLRVHRSAGRPRDGGRAHLGASIGLSPGDRQGGRATELLRSLPSLRALPGLTEDVALQLRSGRVRLQVDAFSGPGRTHLTRWMDQACSPRSLRVGLLASTLMLVGVRVGRDRSTDGAARGRLHRAGDLVGDADAGGRADPAPRTRRAMTSQPASSCADASMCTG